MFEYVITGHRYVGIGTAYTFTGRVVETATGVPAAGVSVAVGGLPALAGRRAVTDADGVYAVTVDLRTDGADVGVAEAWAEDAAGARRSAAAGVMVAPE